MEITRLEENKEYQSAEKEYKKMLQELGNGQKDLFAFRTRLAALEENRGIDKDTGKPNWQAIEKIKKEYTDLKQRCDILQGKVNSFPRYIEIQKQVKPEIIKSGQALNKRFQKALQQLKEASKEYDSLRDLWAGYNKLNPANPNVERFENVIGPVYARQLATQMKYYFEAFLENSKKYQEKKL